MTQLQTSPFDRFRQYQPQQTNQAQTPQAPVGPQIGSPFDKFRTLGQPQPAAPSGQQAGPPAPPGSMPNPGTATALGSQHAPQIQRPPQQPVDGFDLAAIQFTQRQPQTQQGPFSPPSMAPPTQGEVLGPTPTGVNGAQAAYDYRYGLTPPDVLTPPRPGPSGLAGFGQNLQSSTLQIIPPTGRIGELQQQSEFQQPGTGAGGFWGSAVGSVIPSVIGTLFPPAAGPVLAAYAGSSAKSKLDETGNQVSALGAGAIEAGTEMIGLHAAMKFGVDNLGRVGRMLLGGETKPVLKILTDAGIMTAAEGGEEALNVIGTNGLDAALGLQTWEQAGENIQRDAPEAFKSGAAGAILLGVAGLGGQALQQRGVTQSPAVAESGNATQPGTQSTAPAVSESEPPESATIQGGQRTQSESRKTSAVPSPTPSEGPKSVAPQEPLKTSEARAPETPQQSPAEVVPPRQEPVVAPTTLSTQEAGPATRPAQAAPSATQRTQGESAQGPSQVPPAKSTPEAGAGKRGRINSVSETTIKVGGKKVSQNYITVTAEDGSRYRITTEGSAMGSRGQVVDIPEGAEQIAPPTKSKGATDAQSRQGQVSPDVQLRPEGESGGKTLREGDRAQGVVQAAEEDVASLPPRTLDTMSDAIAIASPSGRMSSRASSDASKRLSEKLFGPGGLTREKMMGKAVPQTPAEQASHLRNIARLANKADARKLNLQADVIEGKELDPSKMEYADLRAYASILGLSPVGARKVLEARVRGASEAASTTPADTTRPTKPKRQSSHRSKRIDDLTEADKERLRAEAEEQDFKERRKGLKERGIDTRESGPAKSKGHIDFVGKFEFFKASDGTIRRADASDPIQANGYRMGRFESTESAWKSNGQGVMDRIREQFVKSQTTAIPESSASNFDVQSAESKESSSTKQSLSNDGENTTKPLSDETGKLFESPHPKGTGKGSGGSTSALGSPEKSLPMPAAIKSSRIQPSPLTGKTKPIRDIIVDLEKNVGQVRAGKSSRGSIGTYYPGSSKTIIRFSNDLDTTAHEVAHRLDDLYGIVADWAKPRGISKSGAKLPQKSPFDLELRKPIFQQTTRKNYSVVAKRAEGVAEWMRAWMMNPDAAAKEAPQFTKWFEQKVPQNVRDRLRSFGDDIRRFAGSSGSLQTTANVNLGVDAPSLLVRIKQRFQTEGVGGTPLDKLNAAWNDSLAPVWRGVELAKNLRGITDLRPFADPKINTRLFAGFDRKAMDVLEHGPITAKGDRVSGMGGIDWLLEPVKANTAEQVEKNFQDVVAWGLSERVVERAKILDDAVARAKQLEKDIEQARAAIQQAQQVSPGGAIGGSLVDKLKSDMKELAQLKKKVGFNGPTRRMRSWAELKKQRLSGVGGGVLSDIGVAQETIREISADPARRKRAEEGAKRYRQWSNAVLKYMLDKGRISKEAYNAIQNSNNFYFAMKREYERIGDELIRAGGRKLGTASQVVKKFKGSTRTIENPYVSLIEQTYAFMREADRNAALRTFTQLLTKERGMYEGKAIDFDQIGSIAKSGDQDTISVFVDGREQKWQFAPEIHKALKDFGKTPDQSIVAKIMQAPAHLLRSMVTLSPDFMVRNQIRDPIARSIVSETGSKPWSQLFYITPEGLRQFNSDLSEFRRMGGGLFGHRLVSREDYYNHFREAFDKVNGKGNTIFSIPHKIVHGYRDFAEGGETIGRLAEYHSAKKYAIDKLGYTPEEAALYAAYQSRDIQDFAVAGHAAREVNRYIVFFNAAIRGVSKAVSAAQANPTRFAARWLLYAAVPELAFYLWNVLGDDEEEYQQLPTYQRDFFWNKKIGPDLWLAIPKPWELGVTASGISRAIDYVRGKKNSFEGYAGSLFNSTSPIGQEGLVGPWRGLVEVMANYDFFRGKPIISPWEADLELGLRKGDDLASRVGQLIQKAIGIDARNADHLIRSYLGGIGRTALSVSNIGRDDKPEALVTSGRQISGVLRSSPAAFGKDADWVAEYARKKGQTSKKWYRRFRDVIDTYYDADNSQDRDKAARRIREFASELRTKLESEK